MSLVADIVTVVLVAAGAALFLAGALGLLRFPDTLTRLHALSKADNLGLGLIVLGFLPQATSLVGGLKLVCVWLLAQLSAATASQLLAGVVDRDDTEVMTLLLDLALVAWLLALAIHVVAQPDERSAVVAFLAFGLLLGVAWLRLAAPDVALTEIAIGGGATGILLLRAEAALRGRGREGEPITRAGKLAVAAGCAAVSAGLGLAVLTFASPAPTLAPAAAEALGATGLGNPVTAVLLAYRALDTLLEKVVVLLALVGVWSLAPDAAWGGAPEVRPAAVPGPLAYLARILPPFGVVIGIYMFWVGADAPGGTFQAGTVLAAMWLLAMMAGLAPVPQTGRPLLRLVLTGGPALFLLVAFLGFAFAAGFLAYPEGFAKPLIVAIEAALTLSVAAALAMLVAGPARKAPSR